MNQIIFSDVLHFAVLLAAIFYAICLVLHVGVNTYIKNKKAKQQNLDKEETALINEILAKDPEGAVFKTLEEWESKWEKEGKIGHQRWIDLSSLQNYQRPPDADAEIRKQMNDMERIENPLSGIANYGGCDNPQIIVDIQHGTHYGDISGIFGTVGYNNYQIGKTFSDRPKEEKLVNPTVELSEPDKPEE